MVLPAEASSVKTGGVVGMRWGSLSRDNALILASINDTPGPPLAAPSAVSAPTFASLGLSAALARACAHAGFTTPSPIQVQAIPPLLRGRNLLGLAPTGSGKTAAYALPLLQRFLIGQEGFRRTRVLVLVPTRELAAQVGDVFLRLGSSSARPLKIAVVHGGVSVNPQMMRQRGGTDIVVATPGRLLDLLDRNAVRLNAIQALVLDEADRLLDLGFAAEREHVLAALPAQRQNLLFSATFPPEVQALAETLLHDAVRIEAASQAAARPEIEQRTIAVDAPRRTELLRHLVLQNAWHRVLVFAATRYATEHIAHKLASRGVQAAPFHGEMSQQQRTRALQDLREGAVDVLVTTDLAARGIDVPGLSVVVNYDLPRSPDDYVHRIGRTARAGASGVAVSFVSMATEAHMRLIEKRQDVRLAREHVPGFEPREGATSARSAAGAGGVKGKRPSKKDKLRAAAAKPQGDGSPGGSK